MGDLVLSVADGASPAAWRWVLSDVASGVPVADFAAVVDQSAFEFAGFRDLYRFLRWNADPGRRLASESELVNRVGRWLGLSVLGGDVARVLVQVAPVTVRVVLPPTLGFLAYRPLELAQVDGLSLCAQDVSFVYELAPDGAAMAALPPVLAGVGKAPVDDRLRVLAVFSLPTGQSVLGLRRERYELSRLVAELSARSSRAVELEVLQYGVTRERLTERAADGAGWDVLHLSGHGTAGGFVLERPDGSLDLLRSGELVGLLGRRMASRVKLVVVSACESGAASAAEAMHLLRLETQAQVWDAAADAETAGPQTADPQAATPDAVSGPGTMTGAPGDEDSVAAGAGGLARELGVALRCPVVAMRYPVIDDFAIALTGRLYQLLWESGQPLDAALSMALSDALKRGPSAAVPPICPAVPALFGAGAVGLRLQPPLRRALTLDPSAVRMADFPEEPHRFVGRSAQMAAASAALAPNSGVAGVLLHGMAGAGKTACALELAYRHRDAFTALAFWEGPETPDRAFGALEDLAQRLDTQLGGFGFTMADKVGTVAELEAFLPRLTQLLDDNGLLLVLDNLEHLLDGQGRWRDLRWAALMGALSVPHGTGARVVLTSRTRPLDLDPAQMRVLPIDALSLAESVLLARELPHLRTLFGLVDETVPGMAAVRGEDELSAGRDLVRRALTVVQGHPKLLELADAAAADPSRLAAHLAEAEQAAAAGGGGLQAFLTTGASGLDPESFLAQLVGWTTSTAHNLPEACRLLLQVLCCLEEDDRIDLVLEGNWADVWTRLDLPGEPPGLAATLTPLNTAALVHPDAPPAPSATQPDPDADDPDGGGNRQWAVRYRIHPGVAEAIRADTSQDVRAAVDTELSAYWNGVAQLARKQPGGGATRLLAHAGLAAAPYLMRLGEWDSASGLLEMAAGRDGSPATRRAVIPLLRRIAETTGAYTDVSVLGAALKSVDPIEAEHLLRQGLAGAIAVNDFRSASVAAGQLVNVLQRRGRLSEALQVHDQKTDLTLKAELGPANQLSDIGQRLQILVQMGEKRQVLEEVLALRPRLDQLPDRRSGNETIEPYNVRETMLDIGRRAATELGRWQDALDLNRDIRLSHERRDAGPHELAATRFNDYTALIRLGRLDEGDRLLRDCQQVFEDAADTEMLGRVFGARADLEDERGYPDRAAVLTHTALRYAYAYADWEGAAARHANLSVYLRRTGEATERWLDQRLTAAIIRYATRGSQPDLTGLARGLNWLDGELGDNADAALPATFADLAARVDTVEGVHLADLIVQITGQPDSGDRLLRETLQRADQLRQAALEVDQRLIAQWDPAIALVVAATGGDQEAAAALGTALAKGGRSQDWTALTAVLRRILAGERGQELLDGLDQIDTAIVRRTLDALAGRVEGTDTLEDTDE